MTIIQRAKVNYFVIVLITIILDPYYFLLINHRVQEKIYQMRVLVQYFGNSPITVFS